MKRTRNPARGAIVAVLSLLLLLLTGCSDDDAPSPRAATPLPTGGHEVEPLEPGRYALTANGSRGDPRALVRTSAGMGTFGGVAVGVYEDDAYRALSYWTVAGVYPDPCGKKGALIRPPSTVDGLVRALAAQQLTRTTEAKPVTIDGYHGMQLDMIAPTGIRFADCAQGAFDIWDSDPGGGRYLQAPGQLLRLRLLDLHGSIVVLETTAVPITDTAGLAEMDALAETVTFEGVSGASS